MKQRALSNSYLYEFCMELALLLNAGIGLGDCVLLMQDDEPDKDGKAVLQSLMDVLRKGAPLSAALQESSFFPHYMINMVRVGEKTGRLVETLKALSEQYDRQDRLATAIKNAVLYPAILLITMVAAILLLIIRVLPIFNDVFNRLGSQMSPLSVRLMQFGAWLGGAATIIAAIFGLILVTFFLVFAIPKLRQGIVKTFMNRWGSYGIFGKIASLRFASAMALAIASGLDTEKAVEMAASAGGGVRALDERNEDCIRLLRSGSTLSDAMHEAGILSARNSRMLSLGSRSGTADEVMAEIVRRSDRAIQDDLDRVVGSIEPALVLIASVIIGIILLSVMLPLMSIMTFMG